MPPVAIAAATVAITRVIRAGRPLLSRAIVFYVSNVIMVIVIMLVIVFSVRVLLCVIVVVTVIHVQHFVVVVVIVVMHSCAVVFMFAVVVLARVWAMHRVYRGKMGLYGESGLLQHPAKLS